MITTLLKYCDPCIMIRRKQCCRVENRKKLQLYMSRVHDVISRKVARKYIINNCNHLAKLARYNLHVATDRHGMYGVKYGAASLSRGGLSDTIPVDMPLIETSCHTCPVTTVVTAKNRLRAFAARELQDVYKWCTFHTLLEAS